MQDYYSVPTNDTDQLEQYMAKQPVGLYIDGGEPVFSQYNGGIIDSSECFKEINHGVTGIGYGVSPTGKKYWIIRNSWSNSWGENGYARIEKGVPAAGTYGVCGILYSPYTAVVDKLGS